MQLNPRQFEAVETAGVQLILAGPGSGKTRVITEKVIHLLERGVSPTAILALTFSDKGAQEMADRIAKRTAGVEVAVSTFHAFCLQVLHDHVLESGIAMHAGRISETNQLVWGIRNIDAFGLTTVEVGNNAAGVVGDMLDAISSFRDEAITPGELGAYIEGRETAAEEADSIELGRLRDLLSVYRAYERYKRDEHLIDYDDMVHEAVRLLERRPDVRDEYRRQYTHVLVDEFQDTNYVQLQLLKLLGGDHLCVVGDDDQTIYRFRGAYLTNFDDFRRTWDSCCETLLDRNYRSTSGILALALELMASAPNRQPKEIRTENPEGEPVVVAQCANEAAEVAFIRDEIERLRGTEFLPRGEESSRTFRYQDIAILCRKRDKGVSLARALTQHGIPCTFRGDVELFALPEIRDVMAWLRVVDNPVANGVALYRLMRSAGIPEVSVQRLMAGARRYRDRDLGDDGVYSAMRHAEELVLSDAPLIAELVASVDRFVAEKAAKGLPQLVHAILMHGAGLYRMAVGSERSQSIAALNAFYSIVADYDAITKETTLPDLLEYLSLMADFRIDLAVEEQEDAVQVMTVHKAKGLEFPAVFVVDLSERKFPLNYQSKKFTVPEDLAKGLKTGHDEKELFRQEERRLLYVAMTRAEERLYLTHVRAHAGNKTEAKPSVFLQELAFDRNPLVEVRQVPAPADDALVPGEVRDPLDLRREAELGQLARAAAEARHTAAFVHLVALERLRLQAQGTDPASFDPASFLSAPLPPPEAVVSGCDRGAACLPKAFAFSATSLGCYDSCPRKFKYQYLLEIPGTPETYFSLGTAVHAAIELLSKDRQKRVARSRDDAIATLQAFWDPSAYDSRKHEQEDWATAILQLDNYLAWEAANPNEILDVEWKFSFPFADQVMKGKIDRLERRPDGRLAVVDYKTGKVSNAPAKSRLKDEIQLNLYALAIQEEFGVLPAEASYLYLRETKRLPYQPSEATVGPFRERLSGVIGAILAGEFPAVQSHGCMYCDYREICGTEPAS